jgi:predicted ATP-dependent protease
MRTLRIGRLEIVPSEINWMRPDGMVQPEPIDISVRVILVGDAGIYYQLDHGDPDFRDLFKVLADFDSEIDRSDDNVRAYAAIVARLAQDEGVAALAEHGARIAARGGKLTARFGRISDIAREASFLAVKTHRDCVHDEQVKEAVARTKERAGLPSRRFQELIQSRTILLETDGRVVGQINGLAVINAGPLTYGFPARITATIGPGSAGLINIEGRAQMSGSIHTKGFHILGGLLRHLLQTSHPLAFSASIAFEQSYGGIDGDSASGAEICCLLSALTELPIKQGFAMTGEQGVIIPKSNAGDLMLREDVVAACARGGFHIHAVETIHEAIDILTGVPAGERVDHEFPEGTVLRKAVERAEEFWRRTLQSPQKLTSVEKTEGGDEIVLPSGPEP